MIQFFFLSYLFFIYQLFIFRNKSQVPQVRKNIHLGFLIFFSLPRSEQLVSHTLCWLEAGGAFAAATIHLSWIMATFSGFRSPVGNTAHLSLSSSSPVKHTKETGFRNITVHPQGQDYGPAAGGAGGQEANVLEACGTFLWIASTSLQWMATSWGRGRRHWRFSGGGQGGSSSLGSWDRDWSGELRQHWGPGLSRRRAGFNQGFTEYEAGKEMALSDASAQ